MTTAIPVTNKITYKVTINKLQELKNEYFVIYPTTWSWWGQHRWTVVHITRNKTRSSQTPSASMNSEQKSWGQMFPSVLQWK